jgi:DNA/RNA-binding domain of Phe-tRNA-synthetase-like protein
MQILFTPEIQAACPQLCVATLEATVRNTTHDEALWQQISAEEAELKSRFTPNSLKGRSGIAATRAAYRALGKDPSRYRPSNEALVRRFLQGKTLYQISTLVDVNNLASIKWAYSIGGFDRDKIEGDTLTLGVGRAGEPYEGIGRGPLNIESLPVYRDAKGGIGTPTSDNERTKIGLDTTHVYFTINGYDGDEAATRGCAEELRQLLIRYCDSDGGELKLWHATPTD